MNVSEAVATRRSIRSFLDKPVPFEIIQRILEKARMAPSGCNFQPWEATVLTGAPLKALQERLQASQPDDPMDYDFSEPGKYDKYKARLQAVGAAMYGAMAIARDDGKQRADFVQSNLVSFGAPVLLLCREEGLDTCPQEYMGMYGKTIKDQLGLGEDVLLFCGLAIGYRDESDSVNGFQRERVPLDEQVTFLGF